MPFQIRQQRARQAQQSRQAGLVEIARPAQPPPPPRAAVPPPLSAPPPVPGSLRAPILSGIDWSQRFQPVGTISEEMVRILSLPYIPDGMARCPDRDAYNRMLVLPSRVDKEFALRDIQLDAIWTFEQYGGLIGPQGVGSGKCTCGSTTVIDTQGGRRSVAELGDFTTVGINEKTGHLVERPATAFASGEKECLRITLMDGRSLEVSKDHPIFTQRGWVRADEVKVDKLELVAVARQLPMTKDMEISGEEIRFIAALLCDGGISHQSISFYDDNLSCIEQFEQDCSALGMTTVRQWPGKSKVLEVNVRGGLPITRKWGIQGVKSINKRVPAQFYLLDRLQIMYFMSSFLSGDGTIHDRGVEVCLGSEGLIDDLQWMLLRLGIKSRKRYKKSWYTHKGDRRWKHAWRLSITGEDAIKALKSFKFYGQQEKADRVLNSLLSLKRNTNTDIVPIGRPELMEIYQEMGFGRDGRCTELRERLGATSGQYISRASFEDWVEESGYSGKYAWLAHTDLAWERVDKIEDIGVQPVYDLSVDEHHNYLANGIVIHNTLVAMMSAIRAVQIRRHQRVIILIPPEVFGQFTLRDLPWARERLNFWGINVTPVQGSAFNRMQAASKPGSGVWIYSYSSLSTKTGYDELMRIGATCYIMDEAHNLARSTTARTKRWHSVIRELEAGGVIAKTKQLMGEGPMQGIEIMALSGTITKKSIADYAHIATRALGNASPAPIRDIAVKSFGYFIDSERGAGGPPGTEGIPSDREQQIMQNFVTWATERGFNVTQSANGVPLLPHEQIREAYQHRLRSVPGIVATTDASIDASLLISWREPIRPPSEEASKMVELMKGVVVQGKTPNGDTIDYGMHQFKWLWELSSGFYNNMIWPNLEKVILDYKHKWDRTITVAEAEALLEKAKAHHTLLQEYHKQLRKFLDRAHLPGCDTPMLIAVEILRQQEGKKLHDLPGSLIHAYLEQRAQGPDSYPDLPTRYTTPVRVCDYKLRSAVEWAKEHKKSGGLIWYHHPEIGRWLSELLTEAGIEHTFAPAGQNERAFAKGLVVASYSHGTGKNLQHQCENLFVELRREAHIMEQALGRTHRPGQKADTVRASMLIGNGFDLAFFAGILKDADYAQSSMGQKQRLCFADYDPVVPPVSPRLMYKLGIIEHLVDSFGASEWEALTPIDRQEEAILFRGAAYGNSLK